MTAAPAVRARGLRKTFGRVVAVDGVDLSVAPGTVCAVLGPNGAGKSTLLRMLATLLTPTAGTATVAGFDVVTQAVQVRRSIGFAGQHAAVDDDLTGAENLVMLGRFHHLSRSASRARAESLLREYGLQDAADRLVTTYSGGMRRRLDLAASLVVDPPVLFLDEPTTGLDPTARLDLWEAVRSRKQSGTAVLLTTQYLDEADHLADEVVIIAHGRVVAQGSPEALKNTTGSRADILAAHADDLPRIVTALDRWTIGEAQLDPARRHVSLPIDAGSLTLPGLVRHLDDAGIDVHDAGIRRPTLNEVFLDRITAGLPATSADGGHAA